MTGDGLVTSSDWVRIRGFLYFDSTLTTNLDCADVDNYDLINLRDLLYLGDHIAMGQAAPVCPSGHEQIIPIPSPVMRIEHTSLIPANAGSVEVLFRLDNSNIPGRAANLAVQLSIEGVAPTIDSVDEVMEWSWGWANINPAGPPPGTLAAGFLEPYGTQLGKNDLLTAYITVTPSPVPRLLTVDQVELPPVMDDQFGVQQPVHRTMILDNYYDAWVPEAPVCAIWNTGDVNLDLAISSSDVIAIVNYVFKSGFSPYPCPAAADVNCSGQVTSSDIIHFVNYVFKGGPAPCDVCTLIPGTWSCDSP